MAPPFRQLGGIAALAGIQAIDDVLIPAALAGRDLALPHEFDYFIGLGSVTDQIAEACDGVDALAVDVIKHGLQGCEVGV